LWIYSEDCFPSVKKVQTGRSLRFVTTRDVEEGTELCINYIDTAKDVKGRNKDLEEWYFQCACARCAKDWLELRDL